MSSRSNTKLHGGTREPTRAFIHERRWQIPHKSQVCNRGAAGAEESRLSSGKACRSQFPYWGRNSSRKVWNPRLTYKNARAVGELSLHKIHKKTPRNTMWSGQTASGRVTNRDRILSCRFIFHAKHMYKRRSMKFRVRGIGSWGRGRSQLGQSRGSPPGYGEKSSHILPQAKRY